MPSGSSHGNGLSGMLREFLDGSVSVPSRRIYAHALGEFFKEDVRIEDSSPERLSSYIGFLGRRGLCESTIRQRLSCLRKFFAFAVERGALGANPADAAALCVSLPVGRFSGTLPDEPAVERILAACDDGSATGLRDACILSLAFLEGLPPRRIVGLRREDLDRLPLALPTQRRLAAFARFNRDTNGFVFSSFSNHGRGEPLAPGAIRLILRKRAEMAAVPGPVTARALAILGRLRRWAEGMAPAPEDPAAGFSPGREAS